VTLSFRAALACPCCAHDVERALRAHPHVLAVHVDPARQQVHVTAHAGAVTPAEIQSLIVRAGHGCRCAPLPEGTPAGGDLPALAHQADMAAVTMNTAADRMQYEFLSTAARHHHRAAGAPPAHPGHAAPAHAAHAGMAHDLSDPRMARAMEVDIRNRFVVALVLTVPTVLLSPLAVHTFGLALAPAGWRNWLMLALSTPVVWWSGWPFIGGAAASLRHRTLNMSVLIATGVLAAWGFSLLITLTTRGETFYEAAAMLVTFVLFGHWLEMKSRRGTTDALRALFELVPPTATVIRDGVEQEVPTAQIQVGDRVRLRPGDKVPVDGVVVEGTTSVDESLVTGESIPVEKRPGDPVIGGSINRTGTVVIEALKVGSDTVLAQIVSLVQEAQRSKAPGQRLADRAAAWLVILAVGSGVVTFLAWVVVGNASFHTALTFAISAVVIACPDALGLATPTAIAVATGLGARHQILFKDAATLEGLARVQAVVLDKTGTLTEGRPRLTDIVVAPANGGPVLAEDDLLRLVAAAEQGSEHPLAEAVVQAARERGLTLPAPEEFTAFSGRGIAARVDGHAVLVGTAVFLQERGIDPGPLAGEAERLAEAGKTPMFVAVDGRAAGVVAAADAIKPGARALIPLLRQAGIEVVMITGDNRRTAAAVARELGIERVFAEVLPDQKAEYVRRLQAEGKRVAMVGDGINDAPALAQADVGIAIGAGTDVAIETARVVLMKSDPLDVARAIRLSRATVRKMKQNLFWASVYNVIAIPVAAGVLYPRFGIMLRPEWSALLMSLSSIIVATNAVLLRRVERELDGSFGLRPVPAPSHVTGQGR
jgi:Cu2+-exporting ATPase